VREGVTGYKGERRGYRIHGREKVEKMRTNVTFTHGN